MIIYSINYKFFNFNSIKTKLKNFKYSDTKEINFNNFYGKEVLLKSVFEEMTKVINKLILHIIQNTNNENYSVSKVKSFIDNNNLLDTNESLEKVFKVLVSYGYKRSYARDNILDGYYDSETRKDVFISMKLIVCKIPLKNIYDNSIRVFGFFEGIIFYPLFLDLNHNLMNYKSKNEQFFENDKITLINDVMSNAK